MTETRSERQMSDHTSTETGLTPHQRADYVFPTLTADQLARIVPHGQRRAIKAGEILVEAGDQNVPCFVVISGRLDVVRRDGSTDLLIASHGPGQFSGESNMISGRRALFQMRVRTDGEVVRLERSQVSALVQDEAEIGAIMMRAFILRRVELVTNGVGDAVLLGYQHSPATLRAREFLSRNGHPYTHIDVDREPDTEVLLQRFHVGVADVPVLICRGELVLKNPTNQEI